MSESFRIMMVNAIDTHSWYETRQPILGLGYLVSAVRKFIPDVKFEFRIVDHDVLAEAHRFRPHLIGITFVSQNAGIAAQYVEIFAARNIPVILGGAHISFLPHSMLKGAAAACIGEGEMTFVELVKAAIGGSLNPKTLATISGIAYWDEETLKKTKGRIHIQDLDILPMPARELLPINPHSHMFTSRGCPYRCVFCAATRFWNTVRFHSTEYMADEIELLVRKFGVNLISFYDDLFIAKHDRIENLIRLLAKRNLAGKISFGCNCRANLVNNELAVLLTRLGVKCVTMGLESGDDETLRYLKGGNVTVEQNRESISTLRKHGIKVNAFFIIGSPRETAEQIMHTYDFIRQTKPDLCDVMFLTPFPGTPLWEYAKTRGIVSEESFDWARLNMNNRLNEAIILSEVLDRKELAKLYGKFRRLQIILNLSGLWNHPMRGSFFRTALAIPKQYALRVIHGNSK